jgi:hypothetical protein
MTKIGRPSGERTHRFVDRLKLARETADLSVQGYSSNGPDTAKMGFLSPGELALNTGGSYTAAYRRKPGMFRQVQKPGKFGATRDG